MWYLRPSDPAIEFDPTAPSKAGGVSFLVSFILYGEWAPVA